MGGSRVPVILRETKASALDAGGERFTVEKIKQKINRRQDCKTGEKRRIDLKYGKCCPEGVLPNKIVMYRREGEKRDLCIDANISSRGDERKCGEKKSSHRGGRQSS